MDRSYALLLLLVRLKHVAASEKILRIFIGALRELWPEYTFEMVSAGEASGEGERFPVATEKRRHGELIVTPLGAPEVDASDRALIFNACEALQLVLEVRDHQEQTQDLRYALESGVRRRALHFLGLVEAVITQHRSVGQEVDVAGELKRRLNWIEQVEELLLEESGGSSRTLESFDALLGALFTRTMSSPPQLSTTFASVETGELSISSEAASYAALYFQEVLDALERTIWRKSEAMELATHYAREGQIVVCTLSVSLGETEASPRALGILTRRMAQVYIERGGLEAEQTWQWGAARFSLRSPIATD